ncbi:MAG: MBL fold metallo-hydrolase [Thermoprotei archaeon]|nr:MAG: MBL fold metallo-hydrolase [Thermoprotei archaeon]
MVTITFLGTGASEGVPALNCRCNTCEEARRNPVARRMPTSILLMGSLNLLVDVGFDVMERLGGLDVDAILITHWHPDHYAGLFRLKWSTRRIPVYAPQVLSHDVARDPRNLEIEVAEPYREIRLGEFKVTPIPLIHNVESLGYVVENPDGRVAFLFDTKGLGSRELEYLERVELDVAVVDSTYAPGSYSENHNNVDEALSVGEAIGAKHVVLTHIAHHNIPLSELLSYVKKRGEFTVAHDMMTLNL